MPAIDCEVLITSLLRRYSDWWDRDQDGLDSGVMEHSEIDHFLVTPGLRSHVQRVWIDHDYNPADVSDHWPLMAELAFPLPPNDSGSGSSVFVALLLMTVVAGASYHQRQQILGLCGKHCAKRVKVGVSGDGSSMYDTESSLETL